MHGITTYDLAAKGGRTTRGLNDVDNLVGWPELTLTPFERAGVRVEVRERGRAGQWLRPRRGAQGENGCEEKPERGEEDERSRDEHGDSMPHAYPCRAPLALGDDQMPRQPFGRW